MNYTIKISGIMLGLALAMMGCGVTSDDQSNDQSNASSASVSAETAAPEAASAVPQSFPPLRCEVNGGFCELPSQCTVTLGLPGCPRAAVCCEF